MARTPRTRAQKKYAAAARAQFRLQQSLERIDHEEDIVIPLIEQVAELEKKGTVELKIEMKPLELPR